MKVNINEIEKLIESHKIDEAFNLLKDCLNDNDRDVKCLLTRAKLFYKCQNFGEALNDINLVLDIDRDHQEAKNYKLMIMNILNFWHKDSHNP